MQAYPDITITSLDAARLETLLETLPTDGSSMWEALEAELCRAHIVAPEEVPPSVVTMNSTVRFTLLPSGAERSMKLVYPGSSATSEDAVSILAPVGSALLGLAEGDEIHWPSPSGGTLRLVVNKVEDQPERAGRRE